jgi:hypothetical protein
LRASSQVLAVEMKLRFPIGSRGLLLAVGLGIGGMVCGTRCRCGQSRRPVP